MASVTLIPMLSDYLSICKFYSHAFEVKIKISFSLSDAISGKSEYCPKSFERVHHVKLIIKKNTYQEYTNRLSKPE